MTCEPLLKHLADGIHRLEGELQKEREEHEEKVRRVSSCDLMSYVTLLHEQACVSCTNSSSFSNEFFALECDYIIRHLTCAVE